MSDIVTDDDLSALAAEYVLGTLEPDERARANVLLDVDHGFRGLVRVWEHRFGDLHLMVEPVEPDDKVWKRIKDKLGLLAPEAFALLPAASPQPPPAITPESPPQVSESPPQATSHESPAAEQPDSVHAERLAELVHEVEKLAEAVHADAAAAAKPEAAGAQVQPDPTAPAAVAVADLHEVAVTPGERPARVGRWRAVALVMTAIAFGLSGLIAAWRLVPDRLPLPLRPTRVLMIPEVPPPPVERGPAPHGTQFEE